MVLGGQTPALAIAPEVREAYSGVLASLSFQGPVLEGGSALQAGAVYRYVGVAAGLDALVTVEAINGGAILSNIDVTTFGDLSAFQPEIGGPDGASVDFSIAFVQTGTTTPTVSPDFLASWVDLDGNPTYQEFGQFSDFVSYTFESGTALTISGTGTTRQFVGADFTINGISTNDTQVMASAVYTGVTTFNFRAGISGGASLAQRLFSLSFDDALVNNYANPVTVVVNTPPTAGDDTATTPSDAAVNIAIAGNDTDAEDGVPAGEISFLVGEPAVVDSPVTLASGAVVTLRADRTVDYDPSGAFDALAAGQSTTDSFTYTIADSDGINATATTTVSVSGVNDAPVAGNTAITVDEESTGTLLGIPDPIDVDGDALTVTITGLPTLGTVTLADGTPVANGTTLTPAELTSLLYDAPADYDGVADPGNFTYEVTDGTETVTGTAAIAVNPVNDPPVAADDTYSTTEGAALVVDANAGVLNSGVDIDGDGDTLSVTAATLTTAQGGTVVLNADGGFTYTPVAGYVGPDSFDYDVIDGNGGSDIGTVTLTVDPDADGDRISDAVDLDDDNDGIVDTVEQNGDPALDTDGDGLIDSLDLDADNDGIPDLVEGQPTADYTIPTGTDADDDGLDDAFDPDQGGEAIVPVNTDGVDAPDYQDLDSDSDGTPDAQESGDGDAPTGLDNDGDGLDDAFDDVAGPDATDGVNDPALDLPNADGTGDVDYRDAPPSGVIINEWSQGTDGGKEWVEFLVVGDGTGPTVNLQNAVLADTNRGMARLQLSGPGFATIPVGTYLVIYNGNDPDDGLALDTTVDVANGDSGLLIASTNATGDYAITAAGGGNAWINGTNGAFGNTNGGDVPVLMTPGSGFFTADNTPVTYTPVNALATFYGILPFNSSTQNTPAAPSVGTLGGNGDFSYLGSDSSGIITDANWSRDTNNADANGNSRTPGEPNAQVVIAQSGSSTEVEEGGATDTYTIVLRSQPTAEVTATATPDAQTDLGNGPGVPVDFTFTPGNWFAPQVVTVTAVDDLLLEGTPHPSQITHTVVSQNVDSLYNSANGLPIVVDGVTIPAGGVPVAIADNEIDTDGDGVTDGDDLDDDNDGILDTVEQNGDPLRDTDADGVINSLDLDADNDGIADAVEAQPTVGYTSPAGPADASGINATGLVTPVDTDSDGVADYLDLDSDSDALPDSVESGLTLSGSDANGDGIDDDPSIGASYADPDGAVNAPITDLTNADNQPGDVDFRSVSNAAPVAVDDAVTIDEDTIFNGDVLAANPTTPDSDPENDPLAVTDINGSPITDGQTVTLPSGASGLRRGPTPRGTFSADGPRILIPREPAEGAAARDRTSTRCPARAATTACSGWTDGAGSHRGPGPGHAAALPRRRGRVQRGGGRAVRDAVPGQPGGGGHLRLRDAPADRRGGCLGGGRDPAASASTRASSPARPTSPTTCSASSKRTPRAGPAAGGGGAVARRGSPPSPVRARLLVRLTGRTAHAGTRPMDMRQDSRRSRPRAWSRRSGAEGLATPGLKATVGRLDVSPNTRNVVPGRAQLSAGRPPRPRRHARRGRRPPAGAGDGPRRRRGR